MSEGMLTRGMRVCSKMPGIDEPTESLDMLECTGSATATTAHPPRRRVIGFDSWTGGAHHFQRLQEPLRSLGLELSLVHIGSWGSDPGRPPEELVGDLPVKDISAYGGHFAGVLELEAPAAVIFLSTDTFAHRAFNRYCRLRNVPTVNLYHGLVRVQAVDEGSPYRVNLWAHTRFVSSRLLKSLSRTWPIYIGALWNTRATLDAWLRFLSDIVRGGLGRFSLVSAEDARTDKCCVYVAADVEHAIRKYKFKREDVLAVGNPDLARFGLRANAIGGHLRRSKRDASDVMYVDTALIHTGFVFKSPGEFEQHLIQTAQSLARYGRRMVFKPHPDHLRTNILSRLAEAGIEVSTNEEFVSRLERCCACIAEPSSVSIVPALMGMPLFLAQYGPLAGQRFGEVLTSYPRATLLKSLADFDVQLERERSCCSVERTLCWIDQNTGPLPAEDMPQRVAELVASMRLERTTPPRERYAPQLAHEKTNLTR